MTIVRAPRPKSSYTQIRNEVLRDARLSFRALGVLVEVLSRPDNWSTRAESLAQGRKEGRDAIRAALGELKTAGYLVHIKNRDPDTGQISTVSMVYDEARPSTDRDDGATEDGKPAPGFPATGEPDAGEPTVGVPGAIRTPETNTLKEDSSSAGASSSSTHAAPRQRTSDEDDATRKRKPKVKPKVTDEQRRAQAEARKQQQRAAAIAEICRRIEISADDAELLCDHFADNGARVLDAYVDTCGDDELLDHLDRAQSERDDANWSAQQSDEQRRQKAVDDRRSADDLADQLRRFHHHASSDQFTAVADAIFEAMQDGMTGTEASTRLNRVGLSAAARKVADHYIRAVDVWSTAAA